MSHPRRPQYQQPAKRYGTDRNVLLLLTLGFLACAGLGAYMFWPEIEEQVQPDQGDGPKLIAKAGSDKQSTPTINEQFGTGREKKKNPPPRKQPAPRRTPPRVDKPQPEPPAVSPKEDNPPKKDPLMPAPEPKTADVKEFEVNPATGSVKSVLFTDPTHFIALTSDRKLSFWDTEKTAATAEFDLDGRAMTVNLALADAETLFVATASTVVHWGLKENKPVGSYPTPTGSIRRVTAVKAAKTKNVYFIVANTDGTVRVWMPGKEKPVRVFDVSKSLPVESMAISSDLQRLLAGRADGQVSLWNTNDPPQKLATLPYENGQRASALVFSPKGNLPVAAWEDGTVAVLKPDLSGVVRELTGAGGPTATQLEFTADGGRLIVGGPMRPVRVYAADGWKKLAEFATPEAGINGLALDAGGKQLLTAGRDGVVRLYRQGL